MYSFSFGSDILSATWRAGLLLKKDYYGTVMTGSGDSKYNAEFDKIVAAEGWDPVLDEQDEIDKHQLVYELKKVSLLRGFEQYTNDPNPDNMRVMLTDIEDYCAGFAEHIDHQLSAFEQVDTDCVSLASAIVRADINERVQDFADLVDHPVDRIEFDDVEFESEVESQVVMKQIESPGDLIDYCCQVQREHLMYDINVFAAKAGGGDSQRLRLASKEALRVLGKHAVDVSKIAAGVALGILLTRKKETDRRK